MTQPVNATAPLDTLAGLSAHLTDPGDRETYAVLISYFHSLPPGDELLRLAELLGFLSLFGQRLPNALSEFLEALRGETKAADVYHAKLDERLAHLPEEISAGVDAGAIAKAMSESFRQQIAAIGIEESAQTLGTSAAGLKRLADEIPGYLKPLTTISGELRKVTNASAELRQHNIALVAQIAEERWKGRLVFCIAVLCVGFVMGLAFEKRSTTNMVVGIEGQVGETLQKLAIQAPTGTNVQATKRKD